MAETENTESTERKRSGPGRPTLAETGADPAGKKLSVYLPNRLYALLKEQAEKQGKRPSIWVRELVQRELRERYLDSFVGKER